MNNLQRLNQGYDLVGDIHGHADPLHRLLDRLGYEEVEGIFQHPVRQMVLRIAARCAIPKRLCRYLNDGCQERLCGRGAEGLARL